MEDESSYSCCFACSEEAAYDDLSSISSDNIAVFLQRVGITLPQEDTGCKLQLCSDCQMSIKKFRGAFNRFVSCLQVGIDQQVLSSKKLKKSLLEEAKKTEDIHTVELCDTAEDNQKGEADYSSFSDDSMTLELENPAQPGSCAKTSEAVDDFSDFSLSSLSDAVEQENPPTKSLEASSVGLQPHPSQQSSPFNSSNTSDTKDQPMVRLKETPKKAFTCKKCGGSYKTGAGLRRHITEMHLKLNATSCKICHASFSRQSSLVFHMAIVHNKAFQKQKVPRRRLNCDHCGQIFRKSKDLVAHYESILNA